MEFSHQISGLKITVFIDCHRYSSDVSVKKPALSNKMRNFYPSFEAWSESRKKGNTDEWAQSMAAACSAAVLGRDPRWGGRGLAGVARVVAVLRGRFGAEPCGDDHSGLVAALAPAGSQYHPFACACRRPCAGGADV